MANRRSDARAAKRRGTPPNNRRYNDFPHADGRDAAGFVKKNSKCDEITIARPTSDPDKGVLPVGNRKFNASAGEADAVVQEGQ